MNPMRCFSVLAALALLGGLNRAPGADKVLDRVLVEAEVPLTQLDGDTLRICQIPGDQDRPKEFASKRGATLLVFKRLKP
jgi:hypothetical protein